MTDKAQVTREELMAMREVAAKHWLAGHETGNWPSGSQSHAGEVLAREKALQAYLDREYPLPAPEPQQATGPSGKEYWLHAATHDPRDYRLEMAGGYYLYIENQDRATVANLLVPFEDVVRATLEQLRVCGVDRNTASPGIWLHTESVSALLSRIEQHLPAILQRLGDQRAGPSEGGP